MIWLYPLALLLISGSVALLERFFPARDQTQLRPRLWSDLLHLVFNGHFLGVILFGLATRFVLPAVTAALPDVAHLGVAATWPIRVQIVVALFVVDFIQWCIHNLLHRVPFLWELHKTHHSVIDGEMDWIVAFRFQWTEVVVYKSILYVPLAFFGFGIEAVMFHAIFGTLIGHLNHANLDLGRGWWRYILNSPRMHIWHHDYERDAKTTVNYGIIFSIWDWAFGTAYMPEERPARLGFFGVEMFPVDFFGHAVWPLQRVRFFREHRGASGLAGFALVTVAWILHAPPAPEIYTPMLGERPAASQPTQRASLVEGVYAASPELASRSLTRLGDTAAQDGFRHPDSLVSVNELAMVLGSPKLALLDVRPLERFHVGHIPSAQPVDRGDYAESTPIAGLSKSVPELQEMLRQRGVRADSIVVLYGDGGPEAHRLWWTLRTAAAFDTRVLDGGLNAWKAAGHAVAEAGPVHVPLGDVLLSAAESPRRWRDFAPMVESGALLVDTRSSKEFSGETKHRKAARRGHIPGAVHFDWTEVLDADDRLLPPALLSRTLQPFMEQERVIITSCQSGTRSSVLYFALHQMGVPETRLFNYDGSWAEYSKLETAEVQP